MAEERERDHAFVTTEDIQISESIRVKHQISFKQDPQ